MKFIKLNEYVDMNEKHTKSLILNTSAIKRVYRIKDELGSIVDTDTGKSLFVSDEFEYIESILLGGMNDRN